LLVGLHSLSELAGMRGPVSGRELMLLLGEASFGSAPLYVIGHNTNSIAEVRTAIAAGANAVDASVEGGVALRACLAL
jgi:pyruvate carboxylase